MVMAAILRAVVTMIVLVLSIIVLVLVLPMMVLVLPMLVLVLPMLVLVGVVVCGVFFCGLGGCSLCSVDGASVLALRVHVSHQALGSGPKEFLHLHLSVLAAGHLKTQNHAFAFE
jgi:hypothetical protein